MISRRTTTLVLTGVIGIGTTAGVFAPGCGAPSTPTSHSSTASTAANPGGSVTEGSALKRLAERIRTGDREALTTLATQLEAKAGDKPAPLSAEEGAEWSAVIAGLRGGFLKFTETTPRASVIAATEHILAKYSVEGAPLQWVETLAPARDIFLSGLTDANPDVRTTALHSIGKLWSFYPGRTPTKAEERTLADWKDSFVPQIERNLADRDVKTRMAAIECLGLTPIDLVAEKAIKYAGDPTSGDVRQQVLVSFARRPDLLTDDAILKRLHDSEPGIPELAALVLGARGLDKDQIALGRLITSPRPEMRASVIPLLKTRDDLDPVVWLIRLSQDEDELVRAKAAEAMAGKDSPDIRARLREMATKDASPTVRSAAGKVVADIRSLDATVSLPPLPGSPSLTPKAN